MLKTLPSYYSYSDKVSLYYAFKVACYSHIMPSTSPVDHSFTVHCRYNCKVIGILHQTNYTEDAQVLHKQLSRHCY